MVVVIDDMIVALLLLFLHGKCMEMVAAAVTIFITIVVGFEVKAIDNVVGRGRRGSEIYVWLCLIMMSRGLVNQKRVWLKILVLWYYYFSCSLFCQCFTKCSMSYETIPPVNLPHRKASITMMLISKKEKDLFQL